MSLDQFETDDVENNIILNDHSNDKNTILQERMNKNMIKITEQIKQVENINQKIEMLLKLGYENNLISSIWSEENIYENTDAGRIFSLSDYNTKFLLEFHTNIGDKILDPFAGYLNTATNILMNNRRYEGYEINEVFYQKLDQKLSLLKKNRQMMGLEDINYKIYNLDSSNMVNKDKVDVVLTTLPELISAKKLHKTNNMIAVEYNEYINKISQPLLRAYERLKNGGFYIIHFKDVLNGFIYKPIMTDITNLLNQFMAIQYLVILQQKVSPLTTTINVNVLKFYTEQTFPYTHQYILCFRKGD